MAMATTPWAGLVAEAMVAVPAASVSLARTGIGVAALSSATVAWSSTAGQRWGGDGEAAVGAAWT